MTTSEVYSVGSISYPGIRQITSFSYSRSHGITPDVCQLGMAPQSLDPTADDYLPIAIDGYVLLEFDTYRSTLNETVTTTTKLASEQILMQGCRADKASVRKSASSEEWTIPIYDRRWKWKFGSFSGHWNIKKNGVIETRKEKTPRELADLCLEAMGEFNYDTKALDQLEKSTNLSYRKKVRPEVHWDRIPPAQALNDLVTPLGYRVCLGWDDIVRIEKYGEGAYLPTDDLMTAGFDAELPETPDSVTILGGISMHETMWELEPVGLDLDGDWRPIDHLSYAPRFNGKVDWRRTEPGIFDEIKQKLDEAEDNERPRTDPEYRKRNEQYSLATSTVYRCYRLKYPVGTDEGFSNRNQYDELGKLLAISVDLGFRQGDDQYDDNWEAYDKARRELFKNSKPVIPGPKKKNPRTGRLDDYVIEEFEQILPCFETRATLGIDTYTGKLIRLPVEVTGIYYDPDKAWNTDDPAAKKVDGTRVEVIPELGIIRFEEPMYQYKKAEIDGQDRELPYPADLQVLIATPLKTIEGEPARYQHTEELAAKYRTFPAKLPNGLKVKPKKVPKGTDTKVVIKNEIVQTYVAEYELTGGNLLNGFQGQYELKEVTDNALTEELEKQALQAIDVENIKIFSNDSGSGVYAGLKKVDLDGAIQQVAIQQTTQGGMTTTISRNTEVNIYVPDFDERQRNQALKEIIQMHNNTVDNTQQVEPADR